MGDDRYANGRKETFDIADNERLIGCEFDNAPYVIGVTFLKWTFWAHLHKPNTYLII